MSRLLTRVEGAAAALAGLTLICASPLIVFSERVMLHLRWFGGVTLFYWDGVSGSGHFVVIDHQRWMAILCALGSCLVFLGVYLFQRARRLPEHGPQLPVR